MFVLPGVIEAKADSGGVIIAAVSVVGPAVAGQLSRKTIAAADFNPAKRLVIDGMDFVQSGNPHAVAVDN